MRATVINSVPARPEPSKDDLVKLVGEEEVNMLLDAWWKQKDAERHLRISTKTMTKLNLWGAFTFLGLWCLTVVIDMMMGKPPFSAPGLLIISVTFVILHRFFKRNWSSAVIYLDSILRGAPSLRLRDQFEGSLVVKTLLTPREQETAFTLAHDGYSGSLLELLDTARLID